MDVLVLLRGGLYGKANFFAARGAPDGERCGGGSVSPGPLCSRKIGAEGTQSGGLSLLVFIGLEAAKGFARAVTSLGIEKAVRNQMKEKAKRDIPDFVRLFSDKIRVMPVQSGAALAAMAAGIRRNIILQESICFRKVAL